MMLLSDLRYAARSLRRRPGFAAAAITSLALGIGPNAALFSLLDALGFRPLPIDRPDRLVRVFGSGSENFSLPDYHDLAGVPAFSGLAAYGIRGTALTRRDGPADIAMLAVVTPNYFEVVGVSAQEGRTPVARTGGGAPAVIISGRLWRERFAGDRAIAGRPIEINARSLVVAGVLPDGFTGLDPLLAPDVWIQTSDWESINGARTELTDRRNRWLRVVGRLRDGVGIEQASAQLVATRGSGSRVTSDRDYRTRVSRIAGAVFGLVGLFVLLLACANVAGLLLARAEERRHEMAVRAAIGASRGRIVRQLLVESALLAALACGASILLAWWMIRLLPSAIPPVPMLGLDFRLDTRVVFFAMAASAVTILIFGLAPAFAGSRREPSTTLKASAGAGRGPRLRVRHVLVAGQIAVSLALVTSAAFLARGVWNLARVDTGFDRRPKLIVLMSPSAIGYDEAHARAFYQTLVERVTALPGVERVALAKRAPLSLSGGGATEVINVAGHEAPSGEAGFNIHYNIVGAGYFDTMGTRLVRGRDFTADDRPSGVRVAIVSAAFARRFWGSEDAVGRQIAVGRNRTPCAIVGVARDAKYNALTEAADAYLYFPFSQRFAGEATLLVRTSTDERALVAPLRREIAAIDRSVPTLQVMTLGEHLRAATAVERLTASLVSSLGLLGVFLALVGLYTLMSFLVHSRLHEIGVRMALGARPVDIVRQTLAQAARPIASGIGAGVLLAFAIASAIASSVYGVSAFDPLTYVGTAASADRRDDRRQPDPGAPRLARRSLGSAPPRVT